MPAPLFKPGERTVGRAKGTPNKITAEVRWVFTEAARRIGGVDRLVAWVKEAPQNETVFWSTIYPRLMPLRVEGQGPHGEIEVNVKFSIDDLPKKLEERGLPALMFSADKPVLDLDAEVVEDKPNGKATNGHAED